MTRLIIVSQNDGTDQCVSKVKGLICVSSKPKHRQDAPQRSFPQLLSHKHFKQLTLMTLHTVYGNEIFL